MTVSEYENYEEAGEWIHLEEKIKICKNVTCTQKLMSFQLSLTHSELKKIEKNEKSVKSVQWLGLHSNVYNQIWCDLLCPVLYYSDYMLLPVWCMCKLVSREMFMFDVIECTTKHFVGRVFVSSRSGLSAWHAVLLICRLKQSAVCDRVTVGLSTVDWLIE